MPTLPSMQGRGAIGERCEIFRDFNLCKEELVFDEIVGFLSRYFSKMFREKSGTPLEMLASIVFVWGGMIHGIFLRKKRSTESFPFPIVNTSRFFLSPRFAKVKSWKRANAQIRICRKSGGDLCPLPLSSLHLAYLYREPWKRDYWCTKRRWRKWLWGTVMPYKSSILRSSSLVPLTRE